MQAGDYLVRTCPTWAWYANTTFADHHKTTIHPRRDAGDPSKTKPYLPATKQFLVTRNGLCSFQLCRQLR